jgi:hypothetical protein
MRLTRKLTRKLNRKLSRKLNRKLNRKVFRRLTRRLTRAKIASVQVVQVCPERDTHTPPYKGGVCVSLGDDPRDSHGD